MKTIFNLHNLSQAELGQFSVLLSSVLSAKQTDKLRTMLPQLEVIKSTHTIGNTFLTHEQWLEVKAHIENNKIIDAIKLVRQYTSLGLKEAKDYVDAHNPF